MKLEEKIGQMVMVGFEGLEPPDYLLDWLAQGKIGGVILFARNVETPEQVAALTTKLHQSAKYPLLISIDQEGGTVARLRKGFTESPGAMVLGSANSEALAEEVAEMMATELRALGINWNLAPVVDVTHDISNPTVGTRSPGVDAEKVSKIAAAQIRGFQKQKVAACPKHFPGLGNTPVDTHVALAVISGSVDYLWEHDLIPFRAAVETGAATVMVSHVKFEALDSEHPATLSPAVTTRLLREEIGFQGMASTDCMEMKAVSSHYGAGESAVLSILAGMDVVLFSHTPQMQMEAYDAILYAVHSGRISEQRIDESLARIEAVKNQFAITEAPNPAIIRHPDHVAIAQKAARAGMVMLKNELPLPLHPDQNIGLIEFASYMDSFAMGAEGNTNFYGILQHELPHVRHAALYPDAPDQTQVEKARLVAEQSDILIVVTRNAHMNPQQQKAAQEFLENHSQRILLCLRNPYDVEVLPVAETILLTCGDSTPSIDAAVDALMGKFTPSGVLPVPLKVQ